MTYAVNVQGGSHPNPLKWKPQILAMEPKALMFALLASSLALLQYLLSIPHSSFLSCSIYNMCHGRWMHFFKVYWEQLLL